MQIRRYCFSAFLFFLLFPFASLVSLAGPLKSLQNEAIEQKLWLLPEWINLLHYYPNRSTSSGYLSQVDDGRFFNALDGVGNPREEMLATLAGFYQEEPRTDAHPLCRFPARFKWLAAQLAIEEATLPKVVCDEYRQWREVVQAQQVSLIFPTYHLNSPSSMFGHTLLRLDRTSGSNNSKWLSFAVNFGANVQTSDNSLSYAIKGLTGGYPGIFIVTPYYNKIREYNRIEKRDIWEYRLNLTPQEVERMVTHLWELKEINFDYYFFDENCSYRLLELLEVARPGLELTDAFDITAIPIDTVKAIEAAGLIDEVTFRPSQISELKALLAELSFEELDYFEKLVLDMSVTEDEGFVTLSEDRQRKVIDAAYRYLRYQQVNKVRDDMIAKHSHALLRLLNEYPASREAVAVAEPVRPEKGHHSRRVSVGVGERDEQIYQEISIRMAFHSLEDNEHGFLRGAHINMMNLQVRANNETDKIKLYRFDVIDIFSLTPRTRFFKPVSWRVYTGLERQMTDGSDRLVPHVSAAGGPAYELFDGVTLYALGTGRLEYNRRFSDHSLQPAIGVAGGALWHLGTMTSRIELAGEKFSDGQYRSRVVLRHNIPIATNHAIYFSASGERHGSKRFSDVSISYRYHFQ